MEVRNIFKTDKLPYGEKEIFEPLCSAKNLLVERIISMGQVTESDQWYNSERNEWVMLQQGKATLELENGKQVHLTAGDYVFIPAHLKHRVAYTSQKPHCIWLAIHFD